MSASTWPMAVPLEKFVCFLIWIKFIPVTQSKEDGGWCLNMFSIQHLLIMATCILADGCYVYFLVVSQVLGPTGALSLAGWCIFIFKISCLTGGAAFPFILGKAACALGSQACHPHLQIPLPTLTFLSSMVILFNVGLAGIHVTELKENLTGLLPVMAVIGINLFAFLSNMVVNFTWIYDLLARVPDGEQQELIEAEDSDAILHDFECLKSGTEYMFLMMFSFVQILIVFSLYNSLQGELTHK